MVFSRKLKWLWAGVALFSISACLSFVPLDSGGDNFMNAPGTDVRCLDQSASVILAFWQSDLQSTGNLSGLWNCAAKAVHVFETRVHGAAPGEYTADEIRTLVSKFFIRNAQISDRLLEQAMKMKAAFLGGPVDRITSQELEKVQAWIDLFHEETTQIYPYVGHFLGRVRLTDESVEEAAASVMALAVAVGEEIAKNRVSLEFETVRALLDELSRFVDSAELGDNLGGVRDRVVLVEMIKNDLVGGETGQISSDEWVPVFRRLAQTARWYLKSKQLDQGL
jgi:hypothetical protein